MAVADPITAPCAPKGFTRRDVLAGLSGAALGAGCGRAAGPVAPVLSLPFVRAATRAEMRAGSAGRIFWSVQPSGNWAEDCRTGRRYGQMAVEYMGRSGQHQILQWAVIDMIRAGRQHSGIEVGFLSVFGQRAAAVASII